jgi:hypothetical protein
VNAPKLAALALLAAGCGMKLPGKSSIPSDVSKLEEGKTAVAQVEAAAPLSPQAKAAGVVPAKTSGSTFIGQADLPPYPDGLHDPLLGVSGDEPFRLSEEELNRWRAKEQEFACTAAHDHCFMGNLWMLEQDADRDRGGEARSAYLYGFGPTEPARPENVRSAYLRENYTAYRTVPATKKNLVPGALIFVLEFPHKHPTGHMDLFDSSWRVGTVDRVDWDMGFVFLKGRKKQLWISAARVGVMSWRPGEKIQVLGGGKRDALGVNAADVVAPQ